MSKYRSFKVAITITGTLNFTPEDVTRLISYLNNQRAQGGWTESAESAFKGRELTEETFDEFITLALRKQVRKGIREGGDLDLDSLVRRSGKVVITPKGQPKFDTTEIAKAAWPFPESN